MDKVEVAPIRPLDDFILQSARFQIPDTGNMDRWTNRVISNLLYYQTNYFILTLIIFLIVGVLHPVQMLFGCFCVAVSFAGFVVASDHQATLRRFKRRHSGASFAIIIVVGYAVIHLFGSILVFLFGIAVPLLIILTHASLRLRTVKNKLSGKVEYIGVRRTPMGLILEAIGMEQEAGS